MAALTDIQISIPKDDSEPKQEKDDFDYSQRGQWLRAAVLEATDGLVSVASLMMGVGAVKTDIKAMIIVDFAGLVAGACSMAIGEFVSVYTQFDVEVAQMKRDKEKAIEGIDKEELPNPMHAAFASALAFNFWEIVPLLAAALIGDHKIRLGIVVAAVSLALFIFGGVGTKVGGTPVVKGSDWWMDGYGYYFWVN